MLRRVTPCPFNDPENEGYAECRNEIVFGCEFLGLVPKNIFCVPGLRATDAKLFRSKWSEARIIAIERDFRSAFMTQAHSLNCEVYQMYFKNYMEKQNPTYRMRQDTTKPRKIVFDYPKFDLAFIDLNVPLTEETIMQFMKNHVADGGLLYVTLPMTYETDADILKCTILDNNPDISGMSCSHYVTGKRTHMSLIGFVNTCDRQESAEDLTTAKQIPRK